jgi:hypothetical protein
MARMYDTSRLPGEFSLAKLTEIYHDELIKVRKYYLDYFSQNKFHNDPKGLNMLKLYEGYNGSKLKKIDMKTLFSYKKILKSGDEGKSFVMPDLEELHTNQKFIEDWIRYAVIDAEATFYLRDVLQLLLQTLSTKTLTHKNPVHDKCITNYDIYMQYWRPFGELMTDMERSGIYIDLSYLKVYHFNF